MKTLRRIKPRRRQGTKFFAQPLIAFKRQSWDKNPEPQFFHANNSCSKKIPAVIFVRPLHIRGAQLGANKPADRVD
jgi:hypothetical protein